MTDARVLWLGGFYAVGIPCDSRPVSQGRDQMWDAFNDWLLDHRQPRDTSKRWRWLVMTGPIVPLPGGLAGVILV